MDNIVFKLLNNFVPQARAANPFSTGALGRPMTEQQRVERNKAWNVGYGSHGYLMSPEEQKDYYNRVNVNPIPAIRHFIQQRPVLNAVAQAPMQRGNTVWGGMQTIRNANDQAEQNQVAQSALRYQSQGHSPEEARKIAEFQNMLMHTAIGTSLSMAAPQAAPGSRPPGASIEEMSNLAGGWKIPGLKAKFDYAMLVNDKATIKQLLPHVPESYLAQSFGPHLYQNLMQKTPQATTQTVPAFQQVSRGIFRALPK